MVRKVYAYPGVASAEIQISVGRGFLKVAFAGGYVDKKMGRPAIYATSDPVTQAIIENSDLFGRRIFIKDITGTPDVKPAAPAPKPVAAVAVPAPVEVEEPAEEAADEEEQAESVEVVEHPEVTALDEAIAILKKIPGVKAAMLRSKVSIKRVAASNGISFPNLDLE